jgi:hypothetical protein
MAQYRSAARREGIVMSSDSGWGYADTGWGVTGDPDWNRRPGDVGWGVDPGWGAQDDIGWG